MTTSSYSEPYSEQSTQTSRPVQMLSDEEPRGTRPAVVNGFHITYVQASPEQERDLLTVIIDDSLHIRDRFVALRSYMRHCSRAQDEILGMDYRRMLTTYYWDVIRHYCYHRAEYRCQQCGNSGSKLFTNHRNADHIGEEYDRLNDLIVLCRECHNARHSIHGSHDGQEDRQRPVTTPLPTTTGMIADP